jgi:nucleoid-associated protein YgaU
MRKEIAWGFGTIAVLLMVLGVLVYRRAVATMGPGDDLAASPPVIRPIEARPHVVVGQDPAAMDPSSDDGSDMGATLAGAEQPMAEREERLHASFLPRQFDQADPDPAGDPPADGGDIVDPQALPEGADPAEPPADADASLVDPFRGQAASLDVDEGATELAAAGDALAMDDPGRLDDQPQWTGADAAAADNQFGAPPAAVHPPAAAAMTGEEYRASALNQPQQTGGGWDNRGREMGRDQERQVERGVIEKGKYTVVPNDNYWTIAEKVYGNGGYFKALHEFNRQHHPRADKLQVGDVIEAPSAPLLAERYPDLCPRQRRVPSARQTHQPASTRHRAGERVYVVSEGDTLFDIARHELGKASRWVEIFDMNHDVLGEDFDYLRPGTELVLPRDNRDNDTVTRKDEPFMQR